MEVSLVYSRSSSRNLSAVLLQISSLFALTAVTRTCSFPVFVPSCRVTDELEADIISNTCSIGVDGELFQPGDFATLINIELMVRLTLKQ